MKKLCLLLRLLPLLILPVRGAGLEEVRDQMPESVQEVTTDLGDSMVSSSSRSLLEKGVGLWRQHLRESCKASLSILAVCVLLGLLGSCCALVFISMVVCTAVVNGA